MSEKMVRRLKFTKFFKNWVKLGKLKKTWANLENLNCKTVEYQQFSNNSSLPKMKKKIKFSRLQSQLYQGL